MSRNLISILVVLVVAIGGFFLWQQQSGPEPTPTTTDSTTDTTEQTAADGDPSGVKEMIIGDAAAPVTIIEYASFTCPHCAAFHKDTYGKIVANYVDTGKVQFIMRDVYFDRFGIWAAMLARCDGGQKFFGIAELIYTNQREWTTGNTNLEVVDNLRKLGRIAGMDESVMEACLQDNAMAEALVAEFQKNAERDEINSTPSFLINGKKYSNMSYADFSDVLDGLLSE